MSEISHQRLNGETDILLRYEWESGHTAVVHVEDKLGARPQPRQAERYAEAVVAESLLAASVLVAPGGWARRHPDEVALYGAVVTFEEIAEVFGARAESMEEHEGPISQELVRRLRWRQSLFDGSAARRAVYASNLASDLMEWNAAAAEVIAVNDGPVLEVAPRQRSDGRAKPGRFIRFLEDLPPHRSGRTPQIQLKTDNGTRPGRVSLEVRGGADDDALKAAALAAGYEVDTTEAGTLVVSGSTHRLAALDISRPVSEQLGRLEDAASVAQGLCEWWAQLPDFHHRPNQDFSGV